MSNRHHTINEYQTIIQGMLDGQHIECWDDATWTVISYFTALTMVGAGQCQPERLRVKPDNKKPLYRGFDLNVDADGHIVGASVNGAKIIEKTPTGHPHAASMALYAQDAAETTEPWTRWQMHDPQHPDLGWLTLRAPDVPMWRTNLQYRRKPQTIRIGEHDVPEPLRVAPQNGTEYWLPNTDQLLTTNGVSINRWINDGVDTYRLANGLVHPTREGAMAHIRAILALTAKKA